MESLQRLKNFGSCLRNLREEGGLTLKTVAEQVGMDMSLLAKIERNERQPSRDLIRLLADYFKIDERVLLHTYLSDQIAYKIMEEEADLSILKAAEEKIMYLKNTAHEK
jgi:transcriptional regulator with XRE-family HTH domain